MIKAKLNPITMKSVKRHNNYDNNTTYIFCLIS